MLRLMLLAGLLVAVALVAWVVIVAVHPRPVRPKPSAFASNAQWAAYYRDLAEDARRTGNEASAVNPPPSRHSDTVPVPGEVHNRDEAVTQVMHAVVDEPERKAS